MSSSQLSFLRLCALASSIAAPPLASAAQFEIVYDNTTTFLERFAGEKTEFGDELTLAGTARTLKRLSFEYYGDFAQQGDEFVKVRIYSNEIPYDLYRNEPTTLLYESGLFGINPGYGSRQISNLNIVLPDIVTVTFEFRGIASHESAGLLLYNPPTVGISYNEFWRRNEANRWEPIIYSATDPSLKAKAAIRLEAVETVRLKSIKVSKTGTLEFNVSGLTGLTYLIESSKDLKTWSLVSTQPVTGPTGSFVSTVPAGTPLNFFRARLP